MDKKTIVYKIIDQHYAEHRDALLVRAKRKVGEFWAEDVVQDTYERAYKYWERIPIDFVGTNSYLQFMLNNRIRDYQNGNIDSVEVEETHWESSELADEVRAVGVLAEVKEHLLRYPGGDRDIIYMHLFYGEKQSVVSQVMGVRQPYISELCRKFQSEVRTKYELTK